MHCFSLLDMSTSTRCDYPKTRVQFVTTDSFATSPFHPSMVNAETLQHFRSMLNELSIRKQRAQRRTASELGYLTDHEADTSFPRCHFCQMHGEPHCPPLAST